MSFSGGSNRSFGRQGSSAAQRKDKKRKQEFHKHKIKFVEEESLNFDGLKSKVSISMEKLGNQIFSNEPSGYTFDNWLKSYNLLLDDFEERADPKNLPKEYYDARQRLTAKLLEPVDVSDIDAEIIEREKEAESVKLRISEALKESENRLAQQKSENSKIEELKKEQTQSTKELEDAQDELEVTRSKQSFFNKLFSRQSTPVDILRNRVNSLRQKNEGIAQDIQRLEEDRDSKEVADDELNDLRERLISLQQEIGDLQGRKLEREQSGEKRKQITSELCGIISGLQLKTDDENEFKPVGI